MRTDVLNAARGIQSAGKPAGRPRALVVRGKSGLHRAGRWVTPSRGDPKESATEMTQPRRCRGNGEMVGEEPTGGRVTGRPGKPRPEQGRTGTDGSPPRGCSPRVPGQAAGGAGQSAS